MYYGQLENSQFKMVNGGFAATLGLTENKLMLKDEDLYTMYHAETCQVCLHNVKGTGSR